MPVSIVDEGALEWVAKIDLRQLEVDAAEMKKQINSITAETAKASKEQQQQLSIQTSQFQSLNAEIGKVQHSIETLRALKLARENFILGETDVTKIAKYNKEIDVLNTEINRLSNAGKQGFDQFGNKIPEAIEKTTTKTNLLTKGFSFFRQAAYLIPGIGIAGIFNLIGEGIVALASSLFKGQKALDDFKTRYNDLTKALDSGGFQDAVKNVSDLKIQVDLAKQGFIDKKDVVEQYNKTMGQTTGQVQTLTEVEQKLTQAGPEYIRMMLLKAAANVALEEAAKKAVEAEKIRQKNLEDFKNTLVDTRVSSGGAGGFGTGAFNASEYDKETERIKQAQQKRKEAQVKIETDAQQQQEAIAKKFLEDAAKISKQLGFDFQGNAADDLNKKLKDEKAGQKDINDLLNERKSLLDQIIGKQRDSFQSGLVKEKSAVDKINESYENLLKKVDEFNAKAKKLGVQQIDTTPLKAAQKIEVDNTIQKQDAEAFIKSVEKQKEAFDRFEKYKLEVGIDNAKLLVSEEIKGFDSYISFLQKKLDELANDQSIGAQVKRGALEKILQQAKTDKAKQDQEQQEKSLQEVLSLTGQYEFKKNQIEQRYSKMREALQKSETTMTAEEYQKRSNELENLHKQEITALENSVVRQGELYRKLGEDTIRFTRDQLKQRLTELRNTLKNDASLTPQMKRDVQSAIDSLESLLVATDDTINGLDRFIKYGSSIKGVFDTLGNSLDPFNKDLADSVKLTSQLFGNVLGVANGIKDFKVAKAKGDVAGQVSAATDIIGAIIQGITLIVQGIKKTQAEIKKAKETVLDFQTQLIVGEQEYQALLRERARTQVTLNKLTLEALSDQKKLLEAQKQTTQQAADDLLKQIQGLTYVSDVQAKQKGLFGRNIIELFSGTKDKIVEVTASLAGKTFDQLEELFNKGQLTGKAKELFQQLQQIKQEGADIDQQLTNLKEKAAEAFTGTTASNIADTIAQGFAEGKNSIADFAGDFESLMRQAIINSLKLKYLEGPVKDLFDQFSTDTQSGGQLTKTEIEDLRNKYNAIIANASQQFEQLQQIAGVNFASTSTSQQNTLVGGFKSMTEDTGNLLAGQFGAVRIAQLQLVDLQKISNNHLYAIETNTFNTWSEIMALRKDITNFYRVEGIKLK